MPPGRPTALTGALIEQIATIIKARKCSYRHAAILAGVPASTAMLWMAKGRAAGERRETGLSAAERREQALPSAQADRLYLDLLDEIEQANTGAVIMVLSEVLEHATDPRNAGLLWKLLGVLDPEYRETRRTEVTGADGGPVRSESNLSPVAIQALAAGVLPVPVVPVAPVVLDDDEDDEDESDALDADEDLL